MDLEWGDNGNARRSREAFATLLEATPEQVERGNREVVRWQWWARRAATDFIKGHRARLRGIPHSEVYGASFYGMVKAARKWREEDGAFSGYAFYFMRKEMQNLVRRHRRDARHVGLLEDERGNVTTATVEGGEGERKALAGELLDIVDTFPHPFPRVVRDYLQGVEQVETGEALGVSGRRVRDWRNLAFAWVRHRVGDGPEPEASMAIAAERWKGSRRDHGGQERKLA